jgi:hypothetical protein
VDVVPVAVVIQADASCADRERAETALENALAAARAPRRSSKADGRWRLRVNVAPSATGIETATASMTDDRGEVVAERTVSDRTSGKCTALAAAVGAWAELVLDDELTRAPSPPRTEAPREPAMWPVRPVETTRERPPEADDGLAAPSDARAGAERGVDVGALLFLRNGAASTGGMFGIAPFVTVPLSERWLLRPSLMYATSTSRVPPDQSRSANLSWIGGRLDFCGRIPGNYINRRGIEFDMCAGGDVVHIWSDLGSVTRGSLGPAAALRGELGHDIALELRTMAGVALNRNPITNEGDAPPFVTSFELGVSMRFQ